MRVLFVNPRSGTGLAQRLRSEAERRGISVLSVGEAAPAETAVVGVAGGDGSLAGVAGIAVDRDVPFVCVPCGTRNHFARDIGLGLDDPVAALAAFDGEERRVDLGEAGGRPFLNNVSFGAYALLQHGRLRRVLERRRIEAVVDGEPVRAAILLVGNNEYDRGGRRERLDAGELSIYATCGFVPRLCIERRAPQVRIEFPGPTRVEAAIDGEAVTLESPVELVVRPRALRLLVPPAR